MQTRAVLNVRLIEGVVWKALGYIVSKAAGERRCHAYGRKTVRFQTCLATTPVIARRIEMQTQEEIGPMRVGERHAVLQRNLNVTVARQPNAPAVGLHQSCQPTS